MEDAKRFLKAMREQASLQTSENDLIPIDEFAWSKFTHVMISTIESPFQLTVKTNHKLYQKTAWSN